MTPRISLFFSIFVLLLSDCAVAEDINFDTAVPSSSQVIEALNPHLAGDDVLEVQDSEVRPKTRSIDMSDLFQSKSPKPKAKAIPHKAKIKHKEKEEQALSLRILFDFDSNDLSEEAKKQLDPIGEALNSNELQSINFRIEGHTDGLGDANYNKKLSQRRAASVKNYLVNKYQIDDGRVMVVGKGKSNLLDAEHPENEVNRRVRIVTLR